MEKKIQDHLNIIKKTIGDTRYILDDAKPAVGIKKVLYRWLILFVVSNLILFIYMKASLYLDFFGKKSYYQILDYLILSYFAYRLCFIYFMFIEWT